MGFPKPLKGSVIYEDKKLYACLATYPITRGHVIVIWKNNVSDLHLLSKKDYEYLMDKVEEIRNILLKTLKIKKIYLIYMDEAKHVHWHLVPRYNKKGYDIFKHKPSKLKDFSLVKNLENELTY